MAKRPLRVALLMIMMIMMIMMMRLMMVMTMMVMMKRLMMMMTMMVKMMSLILFMMKMILTMGNNSSRSHFLPTNWVPSDSFDNSFLLHFWRPPPLPLLVCNIGGEGGLEVIYSDSPLYDSRQLEWPPPPPLHTHFFLFLKFPSLILCQYSPQYCSFLPFCL